MKVLKFGGTSVGSVESILNVKKIIEGEYEPLIVVVSALGGVTDRLIEMSQMAISGEDAYTEILNELAERHSKMIDALIPKRGRREDLKRRVSILHDELSNLLRGVALLQDLSHKTSDAIVSYGERMSSEIVAELVGGKLYDARKFIKTEVKHGKQGLDRKLTERLVKEAFTDAPQLCVVPGFISTDRESGNITNLGRGGSDYTAAIIAAALDASTLEIWTDVDGFMTADPRVITSAYPIDQLSYAEATELCNFGAKVIFPPTIYPVCQKNIPIWVKNTFNPTARGTIINTESNDVPGQMIKGISSINDTALITVQGLGMVGVVGINYRIFKALTEQGISVFLVSQASSENSTSIGVRNADADISCKILSEEFAKEIERGEITTIAAEKNLATIAIVGERMKHTAGLAGKLFGALGRSGISVIAAAQGASETNISFVVELKYLRKALNVIHDSFFLSEYQELNLFICGIGTVGGSLIRQIESQREALKKQFRLKLNLVGVMNGHYALFDRGGINPSDYRERLEREGVKSNIDVLHDGVIGMNIFNSVFVDCTANADVASLYKDFLGHNISVVAANKIAASSDYNDYMELKTIARQRGVKFLFETNVGAGLPIINTINALISSGDHILKLEAVLSGTLNFIFNTISETTPFSETVRMAKEQGYSEPDPRIDLCGMDVMRKLVILSREAGNVMSLDDVEKHLFLPDSFFEGSLEDFWKNLPSLDESFEEKRKVLEAGKRRWRFVAKLENGKGSVSLVEVPSSHPFYNLEGSNNIILITTERYKEYPMMIQGYGAGAEVTAAGVFSDIISIANVR